MRKRILALLMAVVMVIGLVACGSSATTTTTAATTAAATTEAPTTAATTEAETEPSHYPVTITTYNFNKEEVEVTFEKCPERVICTNQSQTELLLYFGLDEYIVGTAYLDGAIREDLQAQYDKLVAEGKELTVKGYPQKEVVLALEPDFIFGWRSAFKEGSLDDVSFWNDMGVGTMILRCSNNTVNERNLDAVLADIADIGAIFDIEDKTDAYIAEAKAMIETINANVAKQGEPLTAVVLEPMQDNTWYCWGENTLTANLVVSAGAKYIGGEGGTLTVEDLINLNPDVIIIDYMETEGVSTAENIANAIATITAIPALEEVKAVADYKIMAVNLTDVYGGGIRMVPSVASMYNFMYGDIEEIHYPVTITTYNYNKEEVEVTFEKCPERVICTNQSQTELLLYFGLDEYIVGTAYLDGAIREDLQAQYEKLVAEGKELTVKGYPQKEVVLALEPDFIFGWRSAFKEGSLDDVSFWNDMGVGTMILRCSNNTVAERNLDAVLADIADIGAIFNIETKTDAYIRDAQVLLSKVNAKVGELEAPLTCVVLEPMQDNTWYCWGENTLTANLTVSAGATYIGGEGGTLTVEDLINLNPDVIIIDYMETEGVSTTDNIANAIASVTAIPALEGLKAVQDYKIMAVNLTDVYGGGIRMVPSVEAMFNFMYGEN